MALKSLKNYYHLMQARGAARKYGYPEKHLKIIGVTGTDGKTTTSALLYHIFLHCGLNVGYISTTEARIGKKSYDTGLHVTSPDPWVLPRYLNLMVKEGVEYAILEATSMGLVQNRFGDIAFDAAVITNIREDHLDYHGTWENYAKSKFLLLKKLKEESIAVLNADDEKSAKWLQAKSEKLKQSVYVKWARHSLVTDEKYQLNELSFDYKGLHFQLPIFGATHNLENVVEAILLAESVIPLPQIKEALKTFHLPSGRMEPILLEPVKLMVDFAHTPAALEHSLNALKAVLPRDRRIITVFGCAGKRDKGRRMMGAVSARLSDITILTAEDPRSETLAQVNTEIFAHAKKEKGAIIARFRNHEEYSLTSLGEIHAKMETIWKHDEVPFLLFDENNKNSRRDAIEMAIRLARKGDCVIVTGKGHELSLAFGKSEKEFSWSDQDEVKKAIKRLKIG